MRKKTKMNKYRGGMDNTRNNSIRNTMGNAVVLHGDVERRDAENSSIEDLEYVRSFRNNTDRVNFLRSLMVNDPVAYRNLLNTAQYNVRINQRSNLPLNPLMNLNPEFDDMLERQYVWEAQDIFDDDFVPNNLTYDNCRRLQDYCELYPRKCYLNRDYLNTFVRPCQNLKNEYVNLHREKQKTQRLMDKFFNSLNFVDTDELIDDHVEYLTNIFSLQYRRNVDPRLNYTLDDTVEYLINILQYEGIDRHLINILIESINRSMNQNYNFINISNNDILTFILALRGSNIWMMYTESGEIDDDIIKERKGTFLNFIENLKENILESNRLSELEAFRLINKFLELINVFL